MKRELSSIALLSAPLLAVQTYALSLPSSPVLTGRGTTNNKREFRLVPYGSSAPEDLENTISCDGRIPGASLELTHWNGNETPDALYADTSTEMAIKFASGAKEEDYLPTKDAPATILNNHFDTDGVLSVWACLEPELALTHKDLIISAAEAGDFAEWTSDNGVKLNFALESILSQVGGDDEQAYDRALKDMPKLALDFEETGGAKYKDLWKHSFETLQEDWTNVNEGTTADVSKASADSFIVIVKESTGLASLSPYVLYRAMKEKDIWEGTTRILHVHEPREGKFQYSYEKIGHGWVGKLVQRHMVPNVDSDCLVKELNEKLQSYDCWETGGPGDSMLSICATNREMQVKPEEMVTLLEEIETKLQEKSAA